MTKQEQFFHENAGFSYGPDETPDQGRARCAVELATAETWAVQNGYEWYEGCDMDADLSWMEESERADADPVYIQMLDSDGRVVQSLGGITNANNAFRRVVRAELALEEMTQVMRGELVVGGAR